MDVKAWSFRHDLIPIQGWDFDHEDEPCTHTLFSQVINLFGLWLATKSYLTCFGINCYHFLNANEPQGR